LAGWIEKEEVKRGKRKKKRKKTRRKKKKRAEVEWMVMEKE
jgi:hypothetical protein